MEDGSAENWIHALDHVLTLPVDQVTPGHRQQGARSDLRRFRDYLNDLYIEVELRKKKGETVEHVREDIRMTKYSDFRQYQNYEATFSDNAAAVYRQLQSR